MSKEYIISVPNDAGFVEYSYIRGGRKYESHYAYRSMERLVRCGECVHCADDWNGNQPMFTCELGRCGESVQPNDFCSYGERAKDE